MEDADKKSEEACSKKACSRRMKRPNDSSRYGINRGRVFESFCTSFRVCTLDISELKVGFVRELRSSFCMF